MWSVVGVSEVKDWLGGPENSNRRDWLASEVAMLEE
jgi:hypothetical protein